MLKRSITGTVIVVLIAGFLALRSFVDYRLFDLFLWGMAIIGTIELQRAFGERTDKFQKIIAVLFSALIFPVAVFAADYVFATAMLFVALNLSALVLSYKTTTVKSTVYNIFSCVYPSAFLLMLHYLNVSSLHYSDLILAFAVTPVVDTMAFFVGSLVKGKKLCPNISPNKTISGAIGGLIGGIITSIAVYLVFRYSAGDVIWNVWADVAFYTLIGVICGVMGELGDLVESRIKRELGIKDMGNILPGHGGVLDRIDGLMFASVALFICFCVIM